MLAGQPVVDVLAQDGAVLHVLAAPAAAGPGDRVEGVVDWARRYDHMQQHSGQHLLSQVFARLFEFETVAVHFGAGESTLDLDAAGVEPGPGAGGRRGGQPHRLHGTSDYGLLHHGRRAGPCAGAPPAQSRRADSHRGDRRLRLFGMWRHPCAHHGGDCPPQGAAPGATEGVDPADVQVRAARLCGLRGAHPTARGDGAALQQ